MSSAACFNSAKADRARMHCLRTLCVSKSTFGGNSGNALNGSPARQTGERISLFLADGIPEDNVTISDTSIRYVEIFD